VLIPHLRAVTRIFTTTQIIDQLYLRILREPKRRIQRVYLNEAIQIGASQIEGAPKAHTSLDKTVPCPDRK
jgi:hypothetical protein